MDILKKDHKLLKTNDLLFVFDAWTSIIQSKRKLKLTNKVAATACIFLDLETFFRQNVITVFFLIPESLVWADDEFF